jgi:arylsulfatase A-like enzyme
MEELPNIILVSLDGVRADVAYSGKFKTLEKLRRRGVTFKRVVSSAPLTPVSHASVFSGLFPPRHGVRHLFLEKLAEDVKTFPVLLKENGYKTHAVVSCPGLHHWYGMDRGFDTYDDKVPPGSDGKDALFTVDVKVRGRAAKLADEVLEKGLMLLDQVVGQRFFIFLHFFDAHWPYEPPAPFDTQYKHNPYEGEIGYAEQKLGQFLAELEHRGLHENTILIVIADHGEDMNGLYQNDHGGKENGHPEEEGHGCLLYDATQMVPMIFTFPQRFGYTGTIEQQVRLVDIAPSILEILNIQTNTKFDGISLLPHLAGKGNDLLGYCETHYPRENAQILEKYPYLHDLKALRIRNGDTEHKIIWHLESDVVEVYDLKNDPNERINLMDALSGQRLGVPFFEALHLSTNGKEE